MEVKYLDWRDIKEINEPTVSVIGYFDGLHKGHQELVKKSQKVAEKRGLKNSLITFSPDPNDILMKQKTKHLQKFSERLLVIASLGVDICYVINFDEDFAKLEPELFLRDVISKLKLSALVCGFDFHYGQKGQGDADSLKKEAPFDVYVIPEVVFEKQKISSTRIKKALINGEIELVNKLLGYKYFIGGRVVHGKRIGHKLGFPTINLAIDEEVLLPKEGVYLAYSKVDDCLYPALVNIGNNPTIAANNDLTIEAHILDFDQEIYQKEVRLYLLSYLRPCQRFDSKEDLSKQLEEDVMKARRRLTGGYFIL